MKRVLLVYLVLLLSFPLYATVSPTSDKIGRVAVSLEEGSMEEKVYYAMKSEYDDEWLNTYTSSPLPFAKAYSSELASLLPIENFLLSIYDKNEVKVLDMESKKIITIVFKDGLFAALKIE